MSLASTRIPCARKERELLRRNLRAWVPTDLQENPIASVIHRDRKSLVASPNRSQNARSAQVGVSTVPAALEAVDSGTSSAMSAEGPGEEM